MKSKATSKLSLRERIAATITRPLGVQIFSAADMLGANGMPKGQFSVRHGRGGRIINEFNIPNLITKEGKNHILSAYFKSGTVSPLTPWYLGLIDHAGFTAVTVNDIYDEINGTNGWDEYDDYTDTNNSANATTRPVWAMNVAASEAISNTTLAKYLFVTSPGTVHGLFVCAGASAATKNNSTSGTGHKLWAATPFTDPIDVAINDDLSVAYTVAW